MQKLNNSLYDLDIFINKYSNQNVESKPKPHAEGGSGYNQKEIIEQVSNSLKELIEGVKCEAEKLMSKNSSAKVLRTNSIAPLDNKVPIFKLNSTAMRRLTIDLSIDNEFKRIITFKDQVQKNKSSVNELL